MLHGYRDGGRCAPLVGKPTANSAVNGAFDPTSGTKRKAALVLHGYRDGGRYAPLVAGTTANSAYGAFDPLIRLRKEKEHPFGCSFSFGADTGIRTRDLVLTKDVLYLLSHISIRYVIII